MFNIKFLFEKIQECVWAFLLYKNFSEILFVVFKNSPKSEITLQLRSGLKIIVKTYLIYWDRGGLNEITDVFIRNKYTKYGLSINENDTVIDLGAHVGVFTIYATTKLSSTGQVIAFEPAPNNYKLLKKNLELNKLINVKTFQLAVSSTNEPSKLYLSESYYEHSLENQTDKFIIVKTDTINRIFQTHKIKTCDLLKLDIEEAEWKAFNNLTRENLKKIRQIAMEYHNSKKGELDKLKSRLIRDGFNVIVVPNNPINGHLYAKRLLQKNHKRCG